MVYQNICAMSRADTRHADTQVVQMFETDESCRYGESTDPGHRATIPAKEAAGRGYEHKRE